MASTFMDFECMSCSKLFERRWFDIGRSFERVQYKGPGAYDEVEVADAEGIGVFCSQTCLEQGRSQLMRAQGVPIPPLRPSNGPIERCAKCDGPVDMSDWHLTYTDGQCEDLGYAVKMVANAYMAVICRTCAPRARTTGTALAGPTTNDEVDLASGTQKASQQVFPPGHLERTVCPVGDAQPPGEEGSHD